MRTEEGVVAVVYKKPRRTPRYLVLKRKKNWEGWELPKGHLEEEHEQTVKQELEEEAGISPDEIEEMEDLEYVLSWEFEDDGKEIRREYRAFLVKVAGDAVVDVDQNPHDEHETGYFLNFDDTKSLLTHHNQAELLEKGSEEIQ